MTTRDSSLSKNDTLDGTIPGLSTKASAKRPSSTSEVPTDLGSTLTRSLKRTRVGTSISKAPHRKRAGNGNKNMMSLPIEIFNHVLSYVTPCSLVALTRTNKAFRRILLNPFSKPIWQSAATRVPGLPICPTWMSEPRYAALLFSKLCTLCGASTIFKPDPYLFVRLCSSCRNTGLMDYDEVVKEWGIVGYVSQSDSIKLNSPRRFCLRQDVERILQERPPLSDPINSSECQLISEWGTQQRRTTSMRANDSYNLHQYLSGLEQARCEELKSIKKQRRQLIHERLFGLGWTPQDFELHEAYVKDWNALVEVAQPLSDPACTTLIPRLTRLLEGNRKMMAQETRREQVKRLLIHFSQQTHPFNNILTRSSGLSSDFPTLANSDYQFLTLGFSWSAPSNTNALPDMNTLLRWDLIRDLYEDDISGYTIHEKFKERIPELKHRLAAWRTDTEEQLIDNLKLECKLGPEVRVEICGETDITAELPASTRFLLRADAIFKVPAEKNWSQPWSGFGDSSLEPLYYPYLLFSSQDFRVASVIPLKPTDLSKFTRHTEAERVAKALLADNNRPDVAYIELKEMGAQFTCLRCHMKWPMNWKGMIKHYMQMNGKWENETGRRPKQATKHKILFTNAHKLRPGAGSGKERLMRSEHVENNGGGDDRMVECKLCLVGWPSTTYDYMPAITQHLRNVHEATGELLENLHYGELTEPFDVARYKAEWCTRWDSYHSRSKGRR